MKSEYTANLALANQPKPTITRWEQSADDIAPCTRIQARRDDLKAANKVKGKAGGFLRSAAFRALNNIKAVSRIRRYRLDKVGG
jgi:hypothetical protein